MEEVERLERPSNPNADYYLTFCFVCQEKAKPGHHHIKNYGAIVCFSCRAFWRRANQKSADVNYVCKFNENCEITFENRRRCQKCRFNRCVAAGMNPEAVLSEQQKEVRFRKVIMKRRKLAAKLKGKVEKPGERKKIRKRKLLQLKRTNASSYDDDELSNHDSFALNFDSSSYDGYSPNHDLNPRIPDTSFNVEASNESDRIPYFDQDDFIKALRTPLANVRALLQPKVVDITEKFKRLMRTRAEDIHWTGLKKTDFFQVMLQISKEFHNFASEQRQFSRLCYSDQQSLLRRNTSLYLQYWFGSYLFDRVRDSLSSDLNTLVEIFKDECDFGFYLKLMQNLQPVVSSGSLEHEAVFAHIVLFDNNGLLHMEKTEDMEDMDLLNSLLFDYWINNPTSKMSLKEMISTLESMSVFCAYHIDWADLNQILRVSDFSNQLLHRIVVPYTNEEESWILLQLDMFDQANRSLPFGDDIINEFMMYSLGVPLSRNYMSNVFDVVNQRIWRTYNIHPEFEDLSCESKRRITGSNTAPTLALVVAKAESCQTGMEQLQMGFGEFEEQRWTELYSSVFDCSAKIKRMSLKENKLMPSRNAAKFEQVLSNLESVVHDPVLFKMNTLISMFLPRGACQNDACINNLFAKYHILFSRRLKWLSKRQRFNTPLATTEEMIETMTKNAAALEDLADLLKDLGV